MGHLLFMPMLRALIPLVAGILLAKIYPLPFTFAAPLMMVAVVAAILFCHSRYGNLFLCLMLIALGELSASIGRALQPLPTEPTTAIIEIDNITSLRNEKLYGNAILRSYTVGDKQFKARTHLRITAPQESGLMDGDVVQALCHFAPYEDDSTATHYERYMFNNGYIAQGYIDQREVIRHSSYAPLRHYAESRIAMLHLSEQSLPIVKALALGDRRDISPEIRHNYTMGGSAHLLAVSGMHIGFLFVFVNLLMAWSVVFLHKGNVLRSITVIAVIWCYVLIVGFAPSVIRAAIMFTILQIGLTLPYYTSPMNTLSLTAFVMLSCEASTLHDAGFLLSMVAVAAILEWAQPIYWRLKSAMRNDGFKTTRYNLFHYIMLAMKNLMHQLIMTLIVASVTSIATLPLVSYMFGNMSLWSVATGPLMTLLCGVCQITTMGWILLPIDSLGHIASWIIDQCAIGMNLITHWCAHTQLLAAEVYISTTTCLICYGIMIAVTLAMWATKNDRKV